MSSPQQQQQLNEQLFSAIESNDMTSVELALLNGADINGRNNYSDTPLILAVKNELSDLVTYLISEGADINGRNNYSDTALMLAIDHKLSDLAIYLIDHGANVNLQDYLGHTPLMSAIKHQLSDLAIYLIDHGANVNAQNVLHDTALSMAVEKKRSEIVNSLLIKGAIYPIEILRDYIKHELLNKLREVVSYRIPIPPELLEEVANPELLKLLELYIHLPLCQPGVDNPTATPNK